MSANKTHYRKVFKSDHLGSADLEDFIEQGTRLVFTIQRAKQEIGAKVAGKKIDCNVAYFEEPVKPLVLNATNSKTLKKLSGSSFLEDWAGMVIELYIDNNVRMKGEVVDGVRISQNTPRLEKPELTPNDKDKWARAITAFKNNGNLGAVLKHMTISKENQDAIKAAANV